MKSSNQDVCRHRGIVQFVQLAEGRDETFSHGQMPKESVHRAEQTVTTALALGIAGCQATSH